MPKVAYLTPMYFADASYIGGGERFPANLAAGVAAAGGGRYQVEVVSYGRTPFRRPLAPGVTLRVLAAAGPTGHPLDAVSWEAVDAVAEADVVHVMQAFTRSSDVALLIARLAGKPVCVTDLGGMTNTLGVQFRSLDLADRVVCISAFAAAMYPTTAPVVTVRGGVDGRRFTPGRHPAGRDRVVYVGRLLPHKGIDRLIRALPADLPLAVCGRPYHPAYFAHLRALAAGKRVQFVTAATDAQLRDLYRRAWAVVLPSVYQDCYGQLHQAPELMGLTLLEGMACGTPAVCSRVGAMPEFVDHGRTGFVFDHPGELTAVLRALADTPGLADRLGAAARAAVDERFDLRVCGRAVVGVYDDLLAARAGDRRAAA